VFLVQVRLPRADSRGAAFPPEDFAAARDDVVIVEAMAKALDERWWRDFREHLERRFAQDVVVVRAQEVRLL